jgi:hypothetical protein
MSLNIGGTGTGRPYAKYNSKADKWFARGPEGADVEIQRPTFIADFDNIATGWLRFREGQAPERVMDPAIDRAAPPPGEGFKRGFALMLFSPRYFGGAVEFTSASIHLANAIKDLYSQYEADKAKHPGQLPVVTCTGSEPMRDRYGTNYRPTFNLVQWVDRPTDLPNASPVEAADIYQSPSMPSQTAKVSAQHVPPPAPKPPTQPAGGSLAEPLF